MTTTHIVTPLPINHPLVQEEVIIPPANKVIHKLEITEEQMKFPIETARAVRSQVMKIEDIRVGNEIVIITEDSQALIELQTICFLQRRFYECIKIVTKRRSGKYVVPYLTNLKEGPH